MERSIKGFFLLLVFINCPLCATLEASHNEDTLSPAELVQLRRVSDVEISPTGQWIAYVLSVPRPIYSDNDGGAWSELHVVDTQGHTRPFIAGKVNISALSWTPEGRYLSFLAKRNEDEHKCLYIIPIDGGEARKILSFDTDIQEYTWAPDGRQVAFIAQAKKDDDTKKDTEHGFDATVFEESRQNARVWIANVYLNAVAPGEETADPPHQLDLRGSASSIHWSPDGKHLALTLAPTPLVDDRYMKRRIHIVDVTEGQSRLEVNTRGKLGALAWSPDGQHLSFIAGVDEHDPREGHLMVVSLTNPQPQDLLPEYPGHIWSLAWQDNDTIMYLGYQGVWTTYAQIDRHGKNNKTLVPLGNYTLQSLSLVRNGQGVAFVGDSPRHPSEVFVLGQGDNRPRRLTHHNPDLTQKQLARQEVIQFKARDGLALEGILIHPLERTPNKRVPLIMMVHGGPEAHHLNGWLTRYSLPGQIAAAHGFASFYTNYRGSTGRGVEFSKLGQADPAGKEFDDLIDAVDFLVSTGLVDRDRVGITGGSYGGYASAWGATYHSDRYAASVMFVGISDQFLSFALGDIPEEHRLVHHLKYPWEDMELVRQRSPINHILQARTPLLILHGDSDTRVHPAHSMALYRVLKTLDQTPVRLVHYPGEGHGNRRTGSRLDLCLRLLRWMQHYLQEDGTNLPPYELDLREYRPSEEKD